MVKLAYSRRLEMDVWYVDSGAEICVLNIQAELAATCECARQPTLSSGEWRGGACPVKVERRGE